MTSETRLPAPVACRRPDCTGGVIDEDGFCGACDRVPAPASVTVPAPAPAAESGRATNPACPRPDCVGGIIDADGFCDSCQRAAPREPGPVGAGSGATWPSAAWDRSSREHRAGSSAITFPPGIPPRPLSRAPLGLGLVSIPPVPTCDPETRLLKDPALPEFLRHCPNGACRAAVGRSRGGVPGQPESTCQQCGAAYSFLPPLRRDEILGQYQVQGCIGYGGQGWVYLARDLNLDGAPVAIKGMRDLASAASHAASAAERATLIEVRHPDIVDIRNFVRHRDPVTDRVSGYIVLEFLDGESLAQKAGRGVLPVAEAIAYILAVLPALGYLHDSGLVYGDFKPANVMQVQDRLKLIDLGGVGRIGDVADRRSVFTRGFRAPEATGRGPSVSADLYTVGRTLAVLTARFGFDREHETTLPGPDAAPAFGAHESFYRFLLRATAADPRHRFSSAAQMAEQLTGVLREVVALEAQPGQRLPPMTSALFTSERDALTGGLRSGRDAALALPLPRPDPSDPAAALVGGMAAADPAEALAELAGAPRVTTAVALRRALARIGAPGELPTTEADGVLEVPPDADPADWRFIWFRGLAELSCGRPREAWPAFGTIRDLLPGELAPKLALALCAELLHDPGLARHYYQTVWRTDDSFVGAAFGVARTYAAEPGTQATMAAVRVLESVPDSLHHHVAARLEAQRLRLSLEPDEQGLFEAAAQLQQLRLGEEQSLRHQAAIWRAALDWLARGGRPARPGRLLLNADLTPDGIGTALERAYLGLRRFAPGRRDRVALVRRAHAARPKSRW
jgi:serine/threonine-protein kinase PknG